MNVTVSGRSAETVRISHSGEEYASESASTVAVAATHSNACNALPHPRSIGFRARGRARPSAMLSRNVERVASWRTTAALRRVVARRVFDHDGRGVLLAQALPVLVELVLLLKTSTAYAALRGARARGSLAAVLRGDPHTHTQPPRAREARARARAPRRARARARRGAREHRRDNAALREADERVAMRALRRPPSTRRSARHFARRSRTEAEVGEPVEAGGGPGRRLGDVRTDARRIGTRRRRPGLSSFE